jgi:hypothetical protein
VRIDPKILLLRLLKTNVEYLLTDAEKDQKQQKIALNVIVIEKKA